MSSFWLTLKQQWTIKISSPLFSIFSLAATLVGSRDHRTQFWKGVIQGPFHQSLVAIGPVVSEEKIKMWNVDGRTKSDDNSSHGLKARWAKNHQLKFPAKYSSSWSNAFTEADWNVKSLQHRDSDDQWQVSCQFRWAKRTK